MANELKITLKKSSIGRLERHKRTLESLKLTKTHKSILVKDTPEIRGMLKNISYMLEVEEIG